MTMEEKVRAQVERVGSEQPEHPNYQRLSSEKKDASLTIWQVVVSDG